MKMYFLMGDPLVAQNPNAVTQEEMDAYTAQLGGKSYKIRGFKTLELALAHANEFDPEQENNELFPVLEIEHRFLEKNLKQEVITIDVTKDEQKDLESYVMPSSYLNKRKITGTFMPNGDAFEAAAEKKSLLSNLPSLSMPSSFSLPKPSMPAAIANNAPSLKNVAIFGASLTTLALATAGLAYFGAPAALGLTGLSMAAEIGVSFGLAAAGAAVLAGAKTAVSFAASKFSKSSEVEAQDEVDFALVEQLSEAQEAVEEAKPASNDAQAKAKAPVVNLKDAQEAASKEASKEASEEASAEAAPEAKKAGKK